MERFIECRSVEEAKKVDENYYRYLGLKDGMLLYKLKKKYEEMDVPTFKISQVDLMTLRKKKRLEGENVILEVV